ncbi:MAG TPA: PEP-CTERM sorting domain-containing protein [Novosphingobium sp.]|nr:PEP-CTERM sorting domain-containing protein [Novosphingobium sp.]
MKILSYLPALAPTVLASSPAYAAGGIPLPEPSSMFLLALGVVGVAVGRRFSSKRGED